MWEYLEFFGELYGLRGAGLRGRLREVLETTDLTIKTDAYVGGLSRGMKQRLCLARALVHDPAVLLLDEPASGVDPRGRYELRLLIRKLGEQGKTVLVSSHILPELADVCDRVGIMERGKLLVAGPVEEIAGGRAATRLLRLRILEGRAGEAPGVLAGLAAVLGVEVREDEVEVRVREEDEAVAAVLERLVGSGLRVGSVTEERMDLEGLYLQLTRGELG